MEQGKKKNMEEGEEMDRREVDKGEEERKEDQEGATIRSRRSKMGEGG